jgi:co-chaperonin GroES (HSP10)
MTIDVKGRAASMSYRLQTIVPADKQIRPLRDVLIVEPLDVVLSGIIVTIEFKRPMRGIVKAVGPGHYPWRYNGEKGRRTKTWKSRMFQPTEVKVGDVIELGMVDGDGYNFQTFLWGDRVHLICREADVSGVQCEDDEVLPDALTTAPALEQQAAA